MFCGAVEVTSQILTTSHSLFVFDVLILPNTPQLFVSAITVSSSFFLLHVFEMASLYIPDGPGTHCADPVGLELTEILLLWL